MVPALCVNCELIVSVPYVCSPRSSVFAVFICAFFACFFHVRERDTLWSLNVLNLASPAHNTGHGLQTRDSALRSENTDTPPASQAPQWHSVTRVSGLARSHRSQFCASMAFFRLATVAITGPAAARSLREISSR